MIEHRTNLAWIIAPLILLVSLCGVYVSGYFYFCKQEINHTKGYYRGYESRWEAKIFKPAAKVHSLFRDKPTKTIFGFDDS